MKLNILPKSIFNRPKDQYKDVRSKGKVKSQTSKWTDKDKKFNPIQYGGGGIMAPTVFP